MSSMPVSRLTTFSAGLVCGGYACAAAFRNGYSLGSTEIDAFIIGSAFAAVVVGSWPLLGLAEDRKSKGYMGHAWMIRFGWALMLSFILVNAIGYAATHRAETVGGRVIEAQGYDRAQEQFAALTKDLADMKKGKAWTSTVGCTDATLDTSIAFCDSVKAKEKELATVNTVLSQGRPAAADPQAEAVAWVLDLDLQKTTKAMPIFLGVVLEIAASILFFASAGLSRREEEPEVVSRTLDVVATPIAAGTAAPVARLTANPAIPALSFKVDGRKMRWVKAKVANDVGPAS